MKKKIYICFCSLLLILNFSACGNIEKKQAEQAKSSLESNGTAGLVIVAGQHQNSEIVDMTGPLTEKITEVYSDFGDIRIIVADGKPEAVRGDDGLLVGYYSATYITQAKESKSKNEPIWERNYLAPQVASMTYSLSTLAPNDPEVDTLAAIFEARELLYSISPKGGDLEILIYDTGLSTSGSLNFLDEKLQNLLYSETPLDETSVQSLIDTLAVNSEIPDLSGIRVTWYGLGKVAEPQPPLTRLNVSNLQTIWGEILRRANAEPSTVITGSEYGYFAHTTSHGAINCDQKVTVVTNQNSGGSTDEGSADNDSVIALNEKVLGFVPNESTLYSEDQALEILAPLASDILSHPDTQVLLVGTTADPNRNGGDTLLSIERAERVRDMFALLGLPVEQFVTIGWGSNPPLYNTAEWSEDGRFIDNEATSNRAVYIMPITSEQAMELLASEFIANAAK